MKYQKYYLQFNWNLTLKDQTVLAKMNQIYLEYKDGISLVSLVLYMLGISNSYVIDRNVLLELDLDKADARFDHSFEILKIQWNEFIRFIEFSQEFTFQWSIWGYHLFFMPSYTDEFTFSMY